MSKTSPTAQPTEPDSGRCSANFIISSIVDAGACASVSYVFTTINPIAGAVCGVTSVWAGHIVRAITDRCTPDSQNGQFVASIIQFFGGIGLGVLATTLMGYSLNFQTVILLSGTLIATGIAYPCIALTCFAIFMCTIGSAVMSVDSRKTIPANLKP